MPMLPGKTVQAKAPERRIDNGKLYASAGWQRLRRAQLARQPLCVECMKQGKLVPATDVDHVRPHKGDKKLFFDAKNLQSLCHSCHAKKTASEDGGWGRVRAR